MEQELLYLGDNVTPVQLEVKNGCIVVHHVLGSYDGLPKVSEVYDLKVVDDTANFASHKSNLFNELMYGRHKVTLVIDEYGVVDRSFGIGVVGRSYEYEIYERVPIHKHKHKMYTPEVLHGMLQELRSKGWSVAEVWFYYKDGNNSKGRKAKSSDEIKFEVKGLSVGADTLD